MKPQTRGIGCEEMKEKDGEMKKKQGKQLRESEGEQGESWCMGIAAA